MILNFFIFITIIVIILFKNYIKKYKKKIIKELNDSFFNNYLPKSKFYGFNKNI